MISHKYKCIFVEIPKTGSSSVRAIIGNPAKPHLNIWQIKYELEHYNDRTHYTGRLNRINELLSFMLPQRVRSKKGKNIFESYYKFSFVRNPWDRVVSLYLRKEGLQMRDRMSFEEFVDWIKYSSSTCLHPVPHTNQLDWLVDPHGNVLVDFIGRFENLENDWAKVAKKLGASEKLPHENNNPIRKKHYSEYYNSRTRDIIAHKFRVDIDYFGYKFIEC